MRSVLSVSLPEKIASQLDKYAKSTGRNKSDIVKESLSIYLWETRFRESRRILGTKAKRVGVVTEDDVFTVVS